MWFTQDENYWHVKVDLVWIIEVSISEPVGQKNERGAKLEEDIRFRVHDKVIRGSNES